MICSSDNDFAQCVCGDKVVVLNRIKRHTLNEVGVAEKFASSPNGFLNIWLWWETRPMGIPGLPGFGLKATAALICRYSRMESVPVTDEPWDGIQIRGQNRPARFWHRATGVVTVAFPI